MPSDSYVPETSIDPFAPTKSLLAKLGSIVAHTQEAMGPHGHPLDRSAVESLLADPEVDEWMTKMHSLAMLPEPRN